MVIPTHNRAVSLMRLLKSIEMQKQTPYEVIIVNDGSCDSTKELLEIWKHQLHKFFSIVFHNPVSKGPGVARNIGIQLASGEIVAFTDDDCILHPCWIKNIRSSKIWQVILTAAGIGGRVLPIKRDSISQYYTFHRILEPPKYNQYLVTANACFLRSALLEVGGFDEGHRYPGGEDNALSFKLTKAEYALGYDKNIVVFHDYRTSIPSFIKTFYRYGKGCAEVTHKYLRKINQNSGDEKS